MDNPENDLEREKQGEEKGVERDKEKVDKGTQVFAVMCMVKSFSDFTNTPWDVVWEKPILEVMNVLAFARAWNKKQEDNIKRYKRTH